MHKVVNGIRVELSSEQEKSVKDEWAENRVLIEKRQERRAKFRDHKNKAWEKISALAGLNEDELKTLNL